MRVTVLACVSALAMSAPAYADDWTGFYAGIHAGYGFGDYEVSGGGSGPGFSYSIDYQNELGAGIAGVQVGYLYQTGQFVFGIEADASTARFRDSIGPIFGEGISLDYATFEADWVASVRLKAGVALEPGILLYATGGAAFSSWTERGGASGGDFDPLETNRTGWAAGAGIAIDLGQNWFGAAEYVRHGFGQEERSDVNGLEFAETEAYIDTVRLALNYRF